MKTLTIASDGYLKCGKPLQIAVNGYLDNCGVIIPPKPIIPIDFGVGGGTKGKNKFRKDLNREEWMKIYKVREDEEILVIIKAFVQCQ